MVDFFAAVVYVERSGGCETFGGDPFIVIDLVDMCCHHSLFLFNHARAATNGAERKLAATAPPVRGFTKLGGRDLILVQMERPAAARKRDRVSHLAVWVALPDRVLAYRPDLPASPIVGMRRIDD